MSTTALQHGIVKVVLVTSPELVATEHVWNKYSLRESIHLKSVTVLIASIYLQVPIKLHLLQSIKPSDFIEKGGFIFNN